MKRTFRIFFNPDGSPMCCYEIVNGKLSEYVRAVWYKTWNAWKIFSVILFAALFCACENEPAPYVPTCADAYKFWRQNEKEFDSLNALINNPAPDTLRYKHWIELHKNMYSHDSIITYIRAHCE